MTEQEKFYKMLREVIEAFFIGFAIAVPVTIGVVVWIIFF